MQKSEEVNVMELANLPMNNLRSIRSGADRRIMQISSISSIVTTTSESPTATPRAKPGVVSPSSTAGPGAPAASSSAPVSAKASSSPAQTGSASSVQEATLAAVYSTTVAGKSYSGSVEESGGEYEASVANMPGARASGSSVQSAENNLDIKIDTLA